VLLYEAGVQNEQTDSCKSCSEDKCQGEVPSSFVLYKLYFFVFLKLTACNLAKVGGRNTVLVDAVSRRIPLVTDRPTIIFGADVTHPHPGEDSSPSIAAVSRMTSDNPLFSFNA